MSHSLDYNIREQLAEYLAHEISLHVFEDWFFAETWDVDETDNQTLANLVYGIKLRLAEFSHGDWTEPELRSLLHSISERYVIVENNAMLDSQLQVQHGSSSTNCQIQLPVIYSGRHVDIVSSTEYV